ncbi:hypothetical protein CVT24_001750 [Panaeolus cyanescens]|uniref:CAF17 C-terminal domain-containing protein n=1 Tax=Panaeolus cyanescens TaxID=181874 RepID=A0A409YUC8_9AGAR|nr:hypothetical protein CVT24_001750 [Panaeolus cyanescens]
MYDIFLYANPNGYFLEYDSRSSEAPSLLSYFKKHVLRSKVKVRDVTEEYDVWSAWGAPEDSSFEMKRSWRHAASGVIEPVWNPSEVWPWGTEENIIYDRRGAGMGRRLLLRKGDKPLSSSHDILSSDEYKLHRILHGIPEGISDIVPMHSFPMDSNLDVMGGIDYRKGCYVGQELTVRTYHTGVIRKRILPIRISSSSDSSMPSQELPEDLDVKPVAVSSGERTGPKPRGSGKLLSNTQGVGLALLRLEHVSALQNGQLGLRIEHTDSSGSIRSYNVEPWWPAWWPPEPEPTAQENHEAS